MKTLLFIIGILLASLAAGMAQVSVEVVIDQKQYLPSEAIPVAVKITNRSGQRIHLGADDGWLTFRMQSDQGADVVKNGEVPVTGEFDLESSQMGTKHVDLSPSFTLVKSGRYQVVATLHIKAWHAQVSSIPVFLDVVDGVPVWSQNFGVAVAGENRGPQVRTYALLKEAYLTSELRLYVQVSDPATGQIFKVNRVGTLVSFSEPEAQVDAQSFLHVLYQSGGALFSYDVIDPNGNVFRHELYDYVSTHPRLAVNDAGEITVRGGVKRLKADEMPAVKMPNEVNIPARR